MHILIVEDDEVARDYLAKALREAGHTVDAADNGLEGLHMASSIAVDLAIVDRMLPKMDGLALVQSLRATGRKMPVLILSALGDVDDRITGLRAGGDDYLTKPFEFAELIARLRALLRRSAGTRPAVVAGDLRLDPAVHAVVSGEVTIALTPTEFRLLGALAGRHGETVRRRELIATGWPDGAIVHDNTLDVYLGRLRKKLAKLPSEAKIGTVHGVGYRLE